MDIKLTLPQDVKMITDRLNKNGYKAYAVGGCIRDCMMSRTPSDWDICTSALPEQTLEALGMPNIIENGLKHGTVTVRLNNNNYEITTFRTDGDYVDNRHPDSVTFVSDVKDDLSRRDFTVNAMAYNDTDGLQDHFSGTEDIKNRIIRCVGDPDKRFNEDGLRIMRALRFSSQLGFSIEEATAASLRRNAGLLKNISAERIRTEFIKLLCGENAEEVLTAYPDVISVFIPEIIPLQGFEQKNPHHIYDVWTHTVKVVSSVKNDGTMRLAAFLHDIGKPRAFTIDSSGTGHFKGHPEISAIMSDEILRRLKFDNETIRTVCTLIKYHDFRPPAEPKYVRRLMSNIGAPLFERLLDLKRGDAMGQNPVMLKEKLGYIDDLEAVYRAELSSSGVCTLKTLAVNGRDIMSLGIKDGKTVGSVLNFLLDKVIDGEAENNKESLLALASENIDTISE